MKILLINKWVAGATRGPFYYPGTWRDTFELACALCDLGNRVEILTTKVQEHHFKRYQKEFGKILTQKGIKHHFANTYVSFGKNFGNFRLRMFLDEFSVIRNSKPDIIQYMQFGPSLIYPLVRKTPIIFYSCDQFNHYPKEEEDSQNALKSWGNLGGFIPWTIFQNLLFISLAKLWGSLGLKDALIRNAIFILMHPKGYKNLKKKFGSRSKIFFVPKGVNKNIAQSIQQRGNDQIRVLFVGTTINRKGIFDLLEAVKIVQNKNPNVELLIAGTGPGIAVAKLKRQIADLNLNARYLGPISFTKRWSILGKSDIFCLPSYQDAYPSAILEAMASGVPVISTREIDSPIIDGVSGILVKAGDAKSLAAAIEKLINDPNLRERIGQSGKKAVESLAWSKQAPKLINLYESFLSIESELIK
ncbi:MAG: glycosyltransferase family 4 protein [Candidatus Curtissbacteria bacterium]|nr:glycosyltransferase family 4 protein [Candidatus Curtissbacteria bacterium]